jgi:hypothetical protein
MGNNTLRLRCGVDGEGDLLKTIMMDDLGHIGIMKDPNEYDDAVLQVNGRIDASGFTIDGEPLSSEGPFDVSEDGDITIYTLPGNLSSPSLITRSINTTDTIAHIGLAVKGAVAIINGGSTVSGFTISESKTQSYSLFVDKGVVSEDFIIASASEWADFVFDNGYKPMSLKDLEVFITKNKHLPGIPLMEEIKRDGYGVHGMNKLFLQKIEELTLYVIEQEKKIATLEEALDRNKKLETEIAWIKEQLSNKK